MLEKTWCGQPQNQEYHDQGQFQRGAPTSCEGGSGLYLFPGLRRGGCKGWKEGYSSHFQTALKGIPYDHAFRLHAQSLHHTTREVQGAGSELSAGASAEKQKARPSTPWASLAPSPPGPKHGSRHSEETLVLKRPTSTSALQGSSLRHPCPQLPGRPAPAKPPSPRRYTVYSRCSVKSNSLPLPLARALRAAAARAPPAGSRR